MSITITPTLEQRLVELARSEGRAADELVVEALLDYLAQREASPLDADIAAFEVLHAQRRQSSLGKYVAIKDGDLVDQADDFESLFLRMQAEYGETPFLIRKVEETPTPQWQFRSPRRVSP